MVHAHARRRPRPARQAPAGGRPGAALALFALLAAAGPAGAATYYLAPGGSDSNPGTSPGSAWATIGKANSTLRAGDVCILLAGSYSGTISPSVSGSSGARITYVGSLGNPDAVVVGGIYLERSWITVKGVRTSAKVTLDAPATNDSLAFCVIGGLDVMGAKRSMIARNTVNGLVTFWNRTGYAEVSERDTLRGNRINMGPIPPGHGFKMRGRTQYCLVDSNRVTGTFDGNTIDGVGRILYSAYWNTFRDNHWKFEATTSRGGQDWNGIVMRDSASNHVFERDTLLLGTESTFGILGMLDGSGSYPLSVRDNRWIDCYYKSNSIFASFDQFVGSRFENSVIVAKGTNAIAFYGTFSGAVLDHNTLFSSGQTLRFEGGIATGTGSTITSNILYSQNAQGLSNEGAMTRYSSGVGPGFTQNYNVFFTPNYTSVPGDLSLMWCCYTGSRPGAGTPWFTRTGNDANSRYGSPLFTDSTWAGFDPRLRTGSAAIGAGQGGSDAGAVPFQAAGPDVTPPAAVADLAVTQTGDDHVILAWTAPGDDGLSGLASAYDLRWSNQAITAANFASATPVAVQPVPAAAGTPQSYVMLGLTPQTTYFFALKARDEADNWSGMSNVASATTTATDEVRPASVTDLRTGP